MKVKSSQIIVVGSPDSDVWAEVLGICEKGDDVILHGDKGSSFPKSVEKIHVSKMPALIADYEGLVVPTALELQRERQRIERLLVGERLTDEFKQTLALVGIVVRQTGLKKLVCIPGTWRKRKDFGVLQRLATRLYQKLDVEVRSIPKPSFH